MSSRGEMSDESILVLACFIFIYSALYLHLLPVFIQYILFEVWRTAQGHQDCILARLMHLYSPVLNQIVIELQKSWV